MKTIAWPKREDLELYENLGLRRAIHIRRGGVESMGEIWVGRLQYLPENRKWACYFRVSEIVPEPMRIFGSDPLNALENGLEFVKRLVLGSIKDGWEIWSEAPGDRAGFGPGE